MNYDTYALKARIMPTILTLYIPFFVFNYFYMNDELAKFFNALNEWKFISSLTIAGVLMFLFSQINRGISKAIFEKYYFQNEIKMPTTNYLLHSDQSYTHAHKVKIHSKIENDFHIKLPSQHEELENELLSREIIVEAMSLIRTELRGNKFLLQHNIEYGFARNLIGGSAVSVLITFLSILFFVFIQPVEIAVMINTVLLIVYSLLIFLGKWILNFYGERYAKTLFQEYLLN